MTPETALLDAVTAALKADQSVTAVVNGAVLDEVPADRSPVKPPYVYVGPINSTPIDACATAWRLRMRLYAVSTAFGRRQAWDLAYAVRHALDGLELNLAAPLEAVDPIGVIQSGDVINPANPKTAFLDIEVTVQEHEEDSNDG